MLAASAVMLSPFISFTQFDTALHQGDGRVQAWVLAWVAHAIGTGRDLFDANIFHPARRTLSHTDHMAALGVLGAPIWWTTRNAVLEFNVLQLLGPASSAYAMFVLAFAWTRDRAAAVVAALTYGFSSFTLLHNAHLNLTWSFGLPLALLGFERWWSQPTWRRLVAWWIPSVFTAMVSWYLALVLALLLSIVGIWCMIRDRRRMPARAAQLIASGALAIAMLLPLAEPYLGRGSEAGETSGLAADWRSYLVPSEHTLVGRWVVARGLAPRQTIWGERTLFLGWTFVAIAVLGAARAGWARKAGGRAGGAERTGEDDRSRARLALVVALIGLSLSFGPSASGYAPYDLLARLPMVSGFRATARFALLATLGLALLAAMGVSWLRRRHPRARTILPVMCAVLVMAEVFVVDFPAGKPVSETLPEIYRLAREDGARAAVALPMYAGQPIWYLEGDYLLYSTTGDFLPLANGIGRWVPPEYFAIDEATRAFPSPQAAAALRLYGITHVLFHAARFAGDATARLEGARLGNDFSIVASRGSDTLLRVNPRGRSLRVLRGSEFKRKD